MYYIYMFHYNPYVNENVLQYGGTIKSMNRDEIKKDIDKEYDEFIKNPSMFKQMDEVILRKKIDDYNKGGILTLGSGLKRTGEGLKRSGEGLKMAGSGCGKGLKMAGSGKHGKGLKQAGGNIDIDLYGGCMSCDEKCCPKLGQELRAKMIEKYSKSK